MKEETYNRWKEKVIETWEKGYSDSKIIQKLGIHRSTLDEVTTRLINEGYTRVYPDTSTKTSKNPQTLKKSINDELARYQENKRKTRASGKRLFDSCKELYKIEKKDGITQQIPEDAIATLEEFILEQEGFFSMDNIRFYITLCCGYGKYEEALSMINDCIEAPSLRENIDKFVKLRNQILRQKAIQTARRLVTTQPDIRVDQVAAITGLSEVDVYSIKNGKVPEKKTIERDEIEL